MSSIVISPKIIQGTFNLTKLSILEVPQDKKTGQSLVLNDLSLASGMKNILKGFQAQKNGFIKVVSEGEFNSQLPTPSLNSQEVSLNIEGQGHSFHIDTPGFKFC